MRKKLKILSLFLSLFFLIIGSAFIFFTYTNTGLNALIHGAAFYFNQDIKTEGIQGRLLKGMQIKELNYKYNDLNIKIKNAQLTWNIYSLWPKDISLKQIHFDTIEITQQDKIIILEKVDGSVLINQNQISIRSLGFNYSGLTAVMDAQLQPQYPYVFNSTIRLSSAIKNMPKGIISAAGDSNLIQWSGDFNGPGSFSLKGSLKNLNQIDQIIKWHNFIWPDSKTEDILSKEGRIRITGTVPQLNIELSSKVSRAKTEQWQIQGLVQGTLPWAWNFQFNLAQTENKPKQHEGLFYTQFSLSGEIENPNKGNFKLHIAPGYYQFPEDNPLKQLKFQEGLITGTLSAQGLETKGLLAIDSSKKLNLNFRLPQFNLIEGFTPQQNFSAQLSLVMNSLDFISSLVPDLKNPQGILNLSLNAKGNLKNPQIESKLVINKGSVELSSLGMKLNSIESTLTGKKDRWDGKASLTLGNQALAITGQGLLLPQPTADIRVEGNNLPIMNTNDYQISVSPKLQIKYNQDLVQVLGSILIPSAKIKIQSFSNSVGLSSDVVFEKREEKKPSSIRSQIEVQLLTGDHVELNAKGLHATLTGSVNVKQEAQGTMNAIGELNVIEGEYKAYGQNLKIEQGELFFTGGAIDNPGINLRASKTINASTDNNASTSKLFDFNNNLQNANITGSITVGVEVTGRLVNPEIKLFSTPAILSQADILSMIVLGRPASQANKSGAQLLLTAISSMNLGNNAQGAQLVEQLKQSLGVDFNVETNSNYNLLTNQVSDKTAFVVSKSLSKRISLSYNVGLSQADPNVITLKYLLNKFFSIQVSTSSSSNGVDMLYTSSYK